MLNLFSLIFVCGIVGKWENYLYAVFITHYGKVGNNMDNIEKSRIDDKKRITLPKTIMEALNLTPGDYVAYEIVNGEVHLRKGFLYVRRKNGNGGN
jgi:AbrB family looped-hinge helix DNA binding protein